MCSDLVSAAATDTPGERKGVLPVGTKLGKYSLTSVLGQGGFGITYRAHDSVLNRNVAIKEYLPTAIAVREDGTVVLPRSTEHAADFISGRERFVEEARTLARLEHASAIVRVYDFIEANGTAYMVMALAEGETLAQRLKRVVAISPQEAEQLLYPLQSGLEQVHSAGFLHRDIKPANIIVGENGAPTLIDFGASRTSAIDRSVSMTAIFTPGYAAIEQFASSKQGPWTDIYGLSATIYHALTGKTPPSAIERTIEDTYQPLLKLNIAGLSKAFSLSVDIGLSVKATDRPQTISEWRRLSVPSASEETVVIKKREFPTKDSVSPPPQTITPASQPTPKSGKIKWIAAAAAGVIAVAAGGSVAIWGLPWALKKTVAVDDLRVEDLQKLLDERKKADEAAVERRRLEEVARLKAEEEARRKKQAEAEFAEAQAQRQKAEQELAKLKADIEEQRKREDAEKQATVEMEARRAAERKAQQKIEAEMAALRRAEEEAKQRVAQEAEAKRLADEALAKAQAERQKAEEAALRAAAEAEAKRKADEEAKQKAEAAAEAKRKADDEAKKKAEAEAAALAEKKAAEAAENVLKLSVEDKQRIQVALTASGFDTKGTDGVFGPRSRDMIAAWQKARSMSPTGYLAAAQWQALLKEAAAAVSKFDDDRKKIEANKKAAEDAKKKADDEAKAKAEIEAKKKLDAEASKAANDKPEQKQAIASPQPPAASSGFDGNYVGGVSAFTAMGNPMLVSQVTASIINNKDVTVTISNNCGTVQSNASLTEKGFFTGRTPPFTVTMGCGAGTRIAFTGQVEPSGTLKFTLTTESFTRGNGTLRK